MDLCKLASSSAMGWAIRGSALLRLTLSLSTLTLVASYHLPDYRLLPPLQKHIPPSDAPTFQRNSVEGLPLALGSSNINNELEFGSTSLPLRDAVEASPRIRDAGGMKTAASQGDLELTAERFVFIGSVYFYCGKLVC